ncbi:MAG: hypothetical protein IM622_13255 [Phenylobacterium sp.]|uniref:hypothetical protein n=1 Tax=Phenylobacterium sp. TaxID=1871053 RepID=UPI0025FE037F|nr:hypothetical protein [Phenylobacterium sp.]MCA6346711.1 hypothetical protein [Phenylobacterium sp.]
MSLTTTQFANDYVNALVAQGVTLSNATAFKTTFANQLTAWLGGEDAIPADLAYRLTEALARINAETASRLDWLTGTTTGGPNSDGYYAATAPDGSIFLFPCLAKILAATAKGDPAGVAFTFVTGVTDADPGAGGLKLNNATPASATQVFIDNIAIGGAGVTTWLDSFDDVPGAYRGLLQIRSATTEAFLILMVNGAVVDGSGYRKIPVSWLSGTGGFGAGERLAVNFIARGAPGVSILSGSGVPAAGLGFDGDIYLNLATGDFYGPKVGGVWGSPVLATGLNALVSAAATSATNAASSATAAAGSATAAGTSATNASTSATNAAASATAAASSASAASTSATNAAGSASAAAASATSALGAPGTNATSTTSLTVGTGSRTLTIQTGKAFSVGQAVVIASTASPLNQMSGLITAHNSTTGALTVNVLAINGSGTFAAWTVSLTALAAVALTTAQITDYASDQAAKTATATKLAVAFAAAL